MPSLRSTYQSGLVWGAGGVFCYASDWSCAKDLRSSQIGEAARNSHQELPHTPSPEEAWPHRLGRKGKPRHRATSALPGQEGLAQQHQPGQRWGLMPSSCFLVPAFPMSRGPRVAPGWHLPAAALSPAPGDEGMAKPVSPAVISCPIRRAIKNNRHRHCPGPAAPAGDAEVAAWKINQFPALVGRNHSISWSRARLGLQSPSQ